MHTNNVHVLLSSWQDDSLLSTNGNHSAFTRSMMKIVFSLCVGVLLGYNVHDLICSWMMTQETSATRYSVKYNWGDKVMVDGQEVETLKWFDDILTADNIKNNLM